MALASDQIVLLAEAVRESYATVAALVTDLNTAQESLISDDLDTWESIRNSYVTYKDKADFDNERKRRGIFYRLRTLLGLPYVSFNLDECVMEIFELEVGRNFN